MKSRLDAISERLVSRSLVLPIAVRVMVGPVIRDVVDLLDLLEEMADRIEKLEQLNGVKR